MVEDFSGQNLRGRSFKGHDLTGANFSGSDIRGVNFKGARLAGAVFRDVKAGLSRRFQIVVSLISILVGGSVGILLAFVSLFGFWGLNNLNNISHTNLTLRLSVIILVGMIFCVIFLIRTITTLRRKLFYKVLDLFLIAEIVAIFLYYAGVFVLTWVEAWAGVLAVVLGWVLALTGILTGVLGWACYGAVILALAGILAGTFAFVLAGSVAVVVAVALVVATAWAGVLAGALAFIMMLLSIYFIIDRSIYKEDEFALIFKRSVSFASRGGTNFQGADLQGAEFIGGNLKECRFDASSNISRTCFFQTKNLNLARVTGTILENPAVRDLLVTGNGEGKSCKGCNLKGACLKGSNLTNADLTEADLSGGTLENASLINTNLSKVQALDVEFRWADFTGACLHSWNIDSSTRLEGAHAAYVFLLDNSNERRPSSGEFKEGEFSKLFQEVIHTVDFIFKNGIDWQAFILSYDKLRDRIRVENEAGEIAVQGIENKGDGVFVVRVAVPTDMDKERVHGEFSRAYEQARKMLEKKHMALLKHNVQEFKSREREFSQFREAKEREIAIFRQQNTNLLQQNTNIYEIILELAKRSVRFFKGVIAELPTATKLARELARLVTAISTLFGI